MPNSEIEDRTGLTLQPFAVKIAVAQTLLADKARSEIYEAVGRGLLTAIKDGARTLITVESIQRYMASLPPAKFDRSLTNRRLSKPHVTKQRYRKRAVRRRTGLAQ